MPLDSIPMNTLIVPACEFLRKNYGLPSNVNVWALDAAIGYQESKFAARDQLELQDGRLVPGRVGPATSFWQMEMNGGVKGVMTHQATRSIAEALVAKAGLPFNYEAVWREFSEISGDELASVFARLLIYTHPPRVPEASPAGQEEAWRYYLAVWRPGKPRPEEWPESWAFGCESARAVALPEIEGEEPVPVSRDQLDRASMLARAQRLVEELSETLRGLS